MKYREKKDRIKWCIYITPEVIDLVEKYKQQKIYKSDFIEDAIKYYAATKEAQEKNQIKDL